MGISFKRILIPVGIALLSVIILLIIRSIAFRLLSGWSKKTKIRIDEIIVDALKTPSIFWCIAIGLYVGVAVSELPKQYVSYFNKTIYVLLIQSFTIAFANLVGNRRGFDFFGYRSLLFNIALLL